MDIREIAPPSARNPNLLANGFIPLEHGDGTSPPSRLNGTHEPGGAATDNDNVISHGYF
jgi:hypothetical protein